MNRSTIPTRPARVAAACTAMFGTLLAACGGGSTSVTVGGGDFAVNTRPAFVVGTPATTTYDGAADDLLTAGLGRAGLAGAAPTLSSPATAAELRKLAIHVNYRAIVDINAAGGYGTLYGPNVAADGTVGTGDGKIAGSETIAVADGGTGRQNVTLMVQIPSTFDVRSPCIVSATSSGSRGVYGAIGSAGEWGLKRGCAVAYTDKGTGLGVHDLQANTVNAIDGRRVDAATAGNGSVFTARLTDAERAAFNTATPNRFAVKHAHSEQNPEKDWGLHTLQAIEFAFWVLNERFGEVRDGQRTKTLVPANTLVIASSVSNGAGAALAAAEQDTAGWIDGVAVSEPNVQIAPSSDLRIERPSLPAYTAGAKPLYDYFSYANLLQPCAALAAGAVGSPFAFSAALQAGAGNRCAALATAGLVTGATLQERADDALAKLRAYGWEPETNLLQASHWQFATTSIVATYANTYGRFRVSDNVCGFSFAALDATSAPTAANPALLNGVFATGNGVPPMGATMGLVWNTAVGGARNHAAALSPSTGLYDFAGDGATCLRALWTGSDANAMRVKAGVAETYRSANLRGKPTVIVHGRNDTLIPVNFSSRPYVLRNAQVEGAGSRLRYVEVTNAQHFDSFLGFAGYSNSYIPLHVYFNRAMDAVWANLKNGTALPPNQVVRTTPRGGAVLAPNPIAASNVPAIAATPAAGDRIEITGTTMRVPD